MKPFFVLGTDTNCGKTYVTSQLLRFFHRQKKQALALKPVATGGHLQNGELVNDDILNLQWGNKQINRWLFTSPVSPHIAAKQENCEVDMAELVQFCLGEQYSTFDYVLIEGAGGLMAPLNDKETWLDFLIASQIPVILVVGMRLGCINHALLTITALTLNKIACLGWIANCLDETMLALPENIATLKAKMPMPHLATIPFNGDFICDIVKFDSYC